MNQQITQKPSITKRLFPVAFIGVLISLYLLHHHLEVKYGYVVGKSICNINQYFDCDSVAKSPLSEFYGFPVALLGLSFFSSICFLFYFYRDKNEALKYLLFALGFISLFPVLILATLSIFVLGKVCLFCAFIYLVAFTLFLVSYFETGSYGSIISRVSLAIKHFLSSSSRSASMLWVLSSVSAFVFFLVIQPLYVEFYLRQRYLSYFDKSVLSKHVLAWDSGRVLYQENQITSIEGVISLTSKDRPPSNQKKISIVEFSDFECPFCQKVAPLLERFFEDNKDIVDLHLLNFPLDKSCNPWLDRKVHENACELAKLVTAKALESADEGFRLHKLIMEEQAAKSLDLEKLKTETSFNGENEDKVKKSIEAQIKLGVDLGIQGTPAIFVNGKRIFYDNFFQIEPVLNEIIEKARGKNGE